MVNATPRLEANITQGSLSDLIGVDQADAGLGAALDSIAEPDAVWAAGDSLALSLADLLPDAAGEVVLVGGDNVPFSIQTSETVTASGIAATHVTASGVDVTGLHYYSFESGITLYSPTDLLINSAG